MDDDQIFNVDQMTDEVFGTMVKRRANEADSHWEQKYGLKNARSRNNRDYLAKYIDEQLIDERYQEVYVDNRQFTSVRTIVPFLTARITAVEVTPANGKDLAIQFAHNFEEVLQRHAEQQKGRPKVRLAVQDVLRGERVGALKWRYDKATNDVVLEHVPASSLLVGKRSKLYQEPDFVRHTQERTVGDIIRDFPHKEKKILELFGVQRGVQSQLEEIKEINEDWIWADIGGELKLMVGWSWNNFVFGKMLDPNWNPNGKNLIANSMVPFIFFNFLNNGSGYVDETSFMEQARYLQSNYNKRGQTIAESARYGGTGVPIFAKGAITQKDVAKIHFSPIQRVLLDTTDVSKAFTTWQAQDLPRFIVEDKYDDRNSIDNIWGTPNVFRGEQSKNNTATQDVLIRNQAEGRLADPVDLIDDSMTRFYQIEAQLMYRYFDEKRYYNYLGSDGKFVSVAVSQSEIGQNLDMCINVKAGTSLPIDRAQRRSTIMELLKMNKVGTLTAYKELGVFDDPEAAYKEYIIEQTNPQMSLEEVDKRVFDREASEDLQIVIGGKVPEEREDISPEYINHLTEWLLTDKYRMLQEKNPQRAGAVSQFIDAVITKAQRKADKLAMQTQPQPGQAPGMPGAPGQPQMPGMPPAGGPPQPGQGPTPAPNPLAGAAPGQPQLPPIQ